MPAERPEVLLSYRIVGGPVGVDQRLTVFSDGAAELDERHRSRDTIRLELGAAELDRLRAELDALPPERWSSLSRLPIVRARELLPFSGPARRTYFELRRRGRTIAGREPASDHTLSVLIEALDEIRLRAVRSQPR